MTHDDKDLQQLMKCPFCGVEGIDCPISVDGDLLDSDSRELLLCWPCGWALARRLRDRDDVEISIRSV